MENKILILDLNHNTFLKFEEKNWISNLFIWNNFSFEMDNNGTHFGYVIDGNISIEKTDGKKFNIYNGMYFSFNDSIKVNIKDNSKGFIVTMENYKGFFNIGGPIEDKGRYKYIDGCSDSLLISPVLKGDPCLNFLYFPKNISQTSHTHPSIRIGIIVEGSGKCITPEQEILLNKNMLFIIYPETQHCFKTFDSEMKIVVYHPDSDFGPTDNNHPMINKTIVNGISASKINHIRTI